MKTIWINGLPWTERGLLIELAERIASMIRQAA
jgi:hypothetical protein